MDINQSIRLGIDAIQNNKFQDAEKIFKSLVKDHPLNPEINHFLGISYQLLNKVNDALFYYKKTVKIKPDFAEAQKNLGNMYYKLGTTDKAIEHYKKSLKLDPKLDEAKVNLKVVTDQKKVLNWVFKNKNKEKNHKKKININPFITKRKVEPQLKDQLYKIHTMELNKTGDVRFGNGKCSTNMKLFETENEIIKSVAKDIKNIVKKIVGSDIYMAESFFNILEANSGTKPHKHLEPFDKSTGLEKQKYSLTYYISVGDQSGKEPGILKLYNPDEKILPTDGTIVIIPSGRMHSAIYDGKKDRVMIGINFYSL